MSSRSSTVGTMSMMCAYCERTSPLDRDPGRPRDDERVAGAAAVGLALPAPERRVARPGPAPRVVVEGGGAADLVDPREALLERLLRVVEELRLVRRARRPALGARAVVGDDHDEGVVELAELAQEVEQTAQVMVGVGEEAGEHLHHPAAQPAGVRGEELPLGHVGVVPGQLRIGGDDAELLLSREGPLPVGLPAVVEHAGVPVRPFLGHVVRRVRRSEAEVQVERLAGIHLLGVGDELDRPVDEVLGEVVPLLRRPRRLDLVVVVDEVRIPLARVPAEEAVEALEAAAQRPAVEGADGRLLVARGQMPLPHHERAVAVLDEHLREQAVLERDHAVVAGIAGGQLGDRRHAVGVVVAPGDDARAARRAQRGRVHVVEAQAALRDGVEGRRLDRAAVAAELPETRVVEHDDQDVRRIVLRSRGPRPRGARLVGRASDDPREGTFRVVLDNGQGGPPRFVRPSGGEGGRKPAMSAAGMQDLGARSARARAARL